MSNLSLFNALARTVGGTQPSAAQVAAGSGIPSEQQPFWFSGLDSGDGSGVTGLAGCFSLPTEKFDPTPMAMILPDRWGPSPLESEGPRQGHKYRLDRATVRLFAGNGDMQTLMAQLVNFADTVTDAFDHHMQAFGEANVHTVDCSIGQWLEVDWGGTSYFAIDFRILIHRGIPVTRTA